MGKEEAIKNGVISEDVLVDDQSLGEAWMMPIHGPTQAVGGDRKGAERVKTGAIFAFWGAEPEKKGKSTKTTIGVRTEGFILPKKKELKKEVIHRLEKAFTGNTARGKRPV